VVASFLHSLREMDSTNLGIGLVDVDFWDGLPLDWALDDAFGEEALAIRHAIEKEFQRDKMIAH